ncbi:hypothetical protein BC939DRAFT_439999 [Gamsiella multidivaricata]|uniref:uncharacterized protein n=1 Tax=Gamsiella multidivaricata TaxID=101098 RepID=UPI00221F425C|nr:uncharacterized protein BC939DRAFT_439999 [Gamsiella multidivaricata]KAG0368977.1 hypothetical protein BGZ54_000673 [Gamsiella multidivaricata]KAI7830248.1 hypothetical protein BC939DRAFT_439999 [Gamsiella multidivaricata]
MTTAMFKTGMNRALLNRDFFQVILDRAYGPNTALTTQWSEQELDSSSSILSNISSGNADGDEDEDDFSRDIPSSTSPTDGFTQTTDKAEEPCPMNDMTGHFLYKIEYSAVSFTSSTPSNLLQDHPSDNRLSGSFSISATSRTEPQPLAGGQLWIVIKSKPIDTALIELTNIMAQLQGGEFAEEYDQVKDLTGFRNSHIREIELAELSWKFGGAMARISTKVYNVLRNDSQQLYALCLEYLDPAMGNITHMNSTDLAPAIWAPDDIHLALRDLASFHAQFLGEEDRLLKMSFLENPTRAMMGVLRPAYEAMVRTNHMNEPGLFSEFMSQSILDYLAHSDEYWAILEKSPRTLVHGDFNTRNICLRFDPSTGAQTLCAYDWELACCHVPQRDVVEFLSFVLPPGSGEWAHYIEYHRLALKATMERQQKLTFPNSSRQFANLSSPQEYMEVAKIALMDFASLRVAMYGISNSFKKIDWLPRILSSVEEQVKRMGPLRRAQDRVHHESKL